MGVLSTIKNIVGTSERSSIRLYECQECGETFESHMDPGSTHLRCDECRSADVEPVQGS